MSYVPDGGDGGVDPSLRVALKKARVIDHTMRDSARVRDEKAETFMSACVNKRKVRSSATPQLDVGSGVLLDRRTVNLPQPTPTQLTVGLDEVVADGGAYAGDGLLSVAGAGQVQVYRLPACTDPPTALDAGHPMPVPHVELRAGQVYYLRGGAVGTMALTLTLAPQADFNIEGPEHANTVVAEIILTPSRRGRDGVALPVSLRTTHGHLLPIPRAPLAPLRARLDLAVNPVTCNVKLKAAVAGRVFIHSHATNVTLDQLNLAAAGNRQGWIAGVVANAPMWVQAALVLDDGTELDYGDCVRYEPVDQLDISLGFEWECNQLFVEARHDEFNENILMRQTQWLNPPSKSSIFVSSAAGVGNRMRIDVEMAARAYGEFVLGPLYSYAQMEGACGEVQRVVKFVDLHKVVVSTSHPILKDTNDGHFDEDWAPLNSKITLENSLGGWGGTAQASFGVPIWMLPDVLAFKGGADGIAARGTAEATAYDERVCGLIAAVDYYIRCIGPGTARIQVNDGPKTRTPIMFRTDFNAMYGVLGMASRGDFDAWIAAHPNRAMRMLPNGFSTPPCVQGPLIGDWLDSITAPGADGKDAMSPPPGFPRHNPVTQQIRYGMGLLGTDPITQHVIAEYRSLGQAGSLKQFFVLAFQFAAEFTLSGAQTWQQGADNMWGPPGAGGGGRERRPRAVAYSNLPSA